jgi:hypothetical protein
MYSIMSFIGLTPGQMIPRDCVQPFFGFFHPHTKVTTAHCLKNETFQVWRHQKDCFWVCREQGSQTQVGQRATIQKKNVLRTAVLWNKVPFFSKFVKSYRIRGSNWSCVGFNTISIRYIGWIEIQTHNV